MNTVVLRDVIRRRVAAGGARCRCSRFAHGTELKMYANEQRGDNPAEFPLRFLPFMQNEKIFDYADPEHGVDVVASISSEQIDALVGVFPEFPRDRVMLSHNGYNQRRLPGCRRALRRPGVGPGRVHDDAARGRAAPRARRARGTGSTRSSPSAASSPTGSASTPCCAPPRSTSSEDRRILTLVAGSGPARGRSTQMHDLAAELGLRRTYFLGPRPQDELATLFNCADVGCFPSYREPFGLVFLECMACGTPVIGADSGGPRDFVTPEVGVLVPETDDRAALADSLVAAVDRALDEDWKQAKGPVAAAYAREKFSVVRQVSDLLTEVDRLTGGDHPS